MLKLAPSAGSWTCVFTLIFASLVLSTQPSSAISLTSAQKSCITQKYGKSALSAITKAKKLSATQSKQFSSCKSPKPTEKTSEPPNVGVSCSTEGEIFSFNNKPLICQKDALGKLKWAIPVQGGTQTPTPTPTPTPTQSTQPNSQQSAPPSIGTTCSVAGETIQVNDKQIVCQLNASGKLEWGFPVSTGMQQPSQSGSTSQSGIPDWARDTSVPFYELKFGLLASMVSRQSGLGNIADPTILELGDKSLRLFFKSGSELQVPIKVEKVGIRSFLSKDGGKSWTLEDGFRIETDAMISVRPSDRGGYEAFGFNGLDNEVIRFTSSDGKDFIKATVSKVDPSLCKNSSGKTVTSLGNDPQVVKVATGYIGYVKSNSLINQPPWTKVACKLISNDGINWSIDSTGTIEIDRGGVVSNLGLFRNKAGNLELLIHSFEEVSGKSPVKRLEVKTSSDEGKSWSPSVNYGFEIGDPEYIETSNGDIILSGGGFDSRAGGAILVLKRQSTSYQASRIDFSDSTAWTIRGAKKEDIQIKNLCLDTDVTSTALFEVNGSTVIAYYKDTNPVSDPSLRSMSCVYAVIGPEKAIR